MLKKLIIILTLSLSLSQLFSQEKDNLTEFISKWIGKPYRYGGKTEKGIDCSAFVQRLYNDVYGIVIPRTCKYQYENSEKVDINEIKLGDIIFFNSKVSPSGWHVGVYIGNDEFIHSANYRDGVKISCLFDYGRLFKGIGRYFSK